MATLALRHTLRGHQEPCVWHLSWCPSGGSFASCGADKTIRLWAAQGDEWSCHAILEEGHQRAIRWCSWSPCGRLLASASFDGMALVWKCEDGAFECIASLEGHESEVKAVAWSVSGAYIATCGRDKSVFVWEAEDDMYEVAAVLHNHSQDVKSVAWHPQDDVLASASYDDTVRVFTQHHDDWHCKQRIDAHTSTVWCACFSPDGSAIVTCSDDRSVGVWRQNAEGAYERQASLAEVHSRPVYTVDWNHGGAEGSDDGELVATGGGDDAVCVIRAPVGGGELERVCRHERVHAGDVNCTAWSPRSNPGWLATAGDDGCIRMWRVTPDVTPDRTPPAA